MIPAKTWFPYLIILLLNFLLIDQAFCQDKNVINGTVLSKADGKAIEGASISWANKGYGSITNSEGNFVIVLNASYKATDSLTFSCIGYQTEKVSIATAIAEKNIGVKLSTAIENLKEVVVRPLSLKQLLDSIIHHNNGAFGSPMKLNGYYREMVFTNNKCTEFSDAIGEYFFDRLSQPDGQLKITASRCRKEIKENKDKDNMEFYKDSKINPNQAFKYAMFSAMIEKYLPGKSLENYKYTVEQSARANSNLKITILPKADHGDEIYQLTLLLKDDCTLKSYQLEIPERLLGNVKEVSMLGLHARVIKQTITVNYTSIAGHIYPGYYSIVKSGKFWGKFLGTTTNQVTENKSEFVAGNITLNGGQAFTKADVYKKGNLCSNGAAINDDLLKAYTIIKPTMQDSVAVKDLGN